MQEQQLSWQFKVIDLEPVKVRASRGRLYIPIPHEWYLPDTLNVYLCKGVLIYAPPTEDVDCPSTEMKFWEWVERKGGKEYVRRRLFIPKKFAEQMQLEKDDDLVVFYALRNDLLLVVVPFKLLSTLLTEALARMLRRHIGNARVYQ